MQPATSTNAATKPASGPRDRRPQRAVTVALPGSSLTGPVPGPPSIMPGTGPPLIILLVGVPASRSGADGEEEEGGEQDQVDAALQQRRPARDHGQHADHHGQREQRPSGCARGRAAAARRSQIDATAIAGMVRPMLAIAEPSARLRLVWTRSRRAARTAASVSGSSTSSAITTPTNDCGKPGRATPDSIAGETALASADDRDQRDQQQRRG